MKKAIEVIDERDPKKKNGSDTNDEDLGFMLWKSELNKELLSFWKSITEQYKE